MIPGVPEQIGPYRIEALCARGGQGVVCRARDTRSDRVVALKLLAVHAGVRQAERLQREARAMAQVVHPNVMRCLEVGEWGGAPYLVLEWVEGESLAACLERRGSLPIEETISIGVALAEALECIHEHGLLHRDVKPANVMLSSDGRVILADLGLASGVGIAASSERLTATGQMLGTPGYWPPEQALGMSAEVGVRSDVYGAGATLYAMLTGEAPRAGESLADLLSALHQPVVAPAARREDVPAALDRLVCECLERAVEDRPSGMQEVLVRLRGADRPGGERSAFSAGAWGGRRSALALSVLVALLLGAGLWLSTQNDEGEPTKAIPPPPAATEQDARTTVRLTPLDGADTYVSEWGLYNNDNHAGWGYLRSGFRQQGDYQGEAWAYFRFPPELLAELGELREAQLELRLGGDPVGLRFGVYRVLEAWEPGTGTCDESLDGMAWGPNRSRADFPVRFTRAALEASPEVEFVYEGVGWVSLDVTELVRGWSRGEVPNYGLCVRPLLDQPRPALGDGHHYVSVVSRNGPDPELWPRLELVHTKPVAPRATFAQRWRAHSDHVDAVLAGLEGSTPQRRLEVLGPQLNEAPGDLRLHVARAVAFRELEDPKEVLRDLALLVTLIGSAWQEPSPGASAVARDLLRSSLGRAGIPIGKLTEMLRFYWHLELPDPSGRAYPSAEARRQMVTKRLATYPDVRYPLALYRRGVKVWPNDRELAAEFEGFPQRCLELAEEFSRAGGGDVARKLAESALKHLELSDDLRTELERIREGG